jgi:hypothetical protein
MTGLRLVVGVVALSTTSAALGGLIAWTILAYEPASEFLVRRYPMNQLTLISPGI